MDQQGSYYFDRSMPVSCCETNFAFCFTPSADVFLFVFKRCFFVLLLLPQASAVKLFTMHHTLCICVYSSWRRVITSDQHFFKSIAVSVNPKAPLRGNQPLCECCRGMSVMVQQARHRQLPLPRVIDKVTVQFWDSCMTECMQTCF